MNAKTSQRPTNRAAARRKADTSKIEEFFAGLEIGVKPSLHINGPLHPTAILTVDFGQPLNPVRLTGEQEQKLVELMRSLAIDVIGRERPITTDRDERRGIYWALLK